ncbi:MAG: spore coat associated protein CotJA [Oscillospiraceae bacterium]|nr:spore coat associated protein CotJA [Oscillospiraceae bacterium]
MDMTSAARPRPEERKPLAMVFITPQQQIVNTLAPIEALRAGTLFPELNKPFMGKRGER